MGPGRTGRGTSPLRQLRRSLARALAVPPLEDRPGRGYNSRNELAQRQESTTANTSASSETPKAPGRFRLPDILEREPDEVTQYDQIFHRGLSNDLRARLENYVTTLVGATTG